MYMQDMYFIYLEHKMSFQCMFSWMDWLIPAWHCNRVCQMSHLCTVECGKHWMLWHPFCPNRCSICLVTVCKVWFDFLRMLCHYQTMQKMCILWRDSNEVCRSTTPAEQIKGLLTWQLSWMHTSVKQWHGLTVLAVPDHYMRSGPEA